MSHPTLEPSMRKKPAASPRRRAPPTSPRRGWLNALGPGLITGASDDDPSGIATYSQAGAKFGFQLCWTLLITFPLMVVIQAISARIGRTTGKGIAGNLRQHYPNGVLQAMVALLFIANTLNIGADLGAMAEASRLLLPAVAGWVYVLIAGTICAAGAIYFDHVRYVSILRWLTLSLLAYFATLFAIHVQWGQFARGLLIPTMKLDRDSFMTVVAVLGTTISPYLFFWQAAQEVEDTKAHAQRQPLHRAPQQGAAALARIRLDTIIGMALSNLVALAIVVTAAATLHQSGHTDITSAAQAAEALKPVAGEFAFALFALGIIGTGLLSVPVLAGSAAYAVGEARHWPVGLARKPRQAKAFYATLAMATLLGAAGNMFKLNPVTALVWCAVLNGVVAVPVMALLMLMASNHKIMGGFCIATSWRVIGWAATGLMGIAAVAMIVASLMGDS
jgi:NRAMP (natural resistance-associated macrophage protein)-like metal ion transporter